MKPALMKTLGITAFAVLTLLILGLGWPGAASAQVQRYWCPDRVGAEIQAQPGPGCEPLVVEEDEIDKVRRLGFFRGRKEAVYGGFFYGFTL